MTKTISYAVLNSIFSLVTRQMVPCGSYLIYYAFSTSIVISCDGAGIEPILAALAQYTQR